MNTMLVIPDPIFTLLCCAVVIVVCGLCWLSFQMGVDVERDKWEEAQHIENLMNAPHFLISPQEAIRRDNAAIRKGLRDAQDPKHEGS